MSVVLFMLTGGIQTGKTRWLVDLIEALEKGGASCYGVLAPGQWIESDGAHADAHGYEKIGIDNKLLPQHETICFALREDVAIDSQRYDAHSQAAEAQLAWHIFDEAIGRVNEHIGSLAERAAGDENPKLLVIDELGRLELLRGQGLSSALSLLKRGPTALFPHALVVVREGLLDIALDELGGIWKDVACLRPDEASANLVLRVVIDGA